jgi:hypothetical protein
MLRSHGDHIHLKTQVFVLHHKSGVSQTLILFYFSVHCFHEYIYIYIYIYIYGQWACNEERCAEERMMEKSCHIHSLLHNFK